MLKKITALSQSAGVRQSMITVGGTSMGLGISAVTTILISRFLGPEQFGWFSLVFAIFSILLKLGDAGFNFAFQKFVPKAFIESEKMGNRTIAQISGLRLRWGIGLLIGAVILTPLVTAVFKLPVWWIMPLAIVGAVIAVVFEHVMAVFQAIGKFTLAVSLLVGQSAGKLGVLFAVLLLGWLTTSAPISVGYFLIPLVILVPITWRLRAKLPVSARVSSQATQTYLPFIKHNAIQVIATGLVDHIDLLLIQVFLSTFETGIFSGVSKIAFLFTSIALSWGNVLNIRLSQYHSSEQRQAFYRKAWWIAGASLGGWMLTSLVSRWLVLLTIGPEYLVAWQELIILLASAWVFWATIPFIALFYSLDEPRFFSWSGVLLVGSMVGFDLLLIPQYGLMGASVARLLARVVVFGLAVAWVGRKIDIKKSQAKPSS